MVMCMFQWLSRPNPLLTYDSMPLVSSRSHIRHPFQEISTHICCYIILFFSNSIPFKLHYYFYSKYHINVCQTKSFERNGQNFSAIAHSTANNLPLIIGETPSSTYLQISLITTHLSSAGFHCTKFRYGYSTHLFPRTDSFLSIIISDM